MGHSDRKNPRYRLLASCFLPAFTSYVASRCDGSWVSAAYLATENHDLGTLLYAPDSAPCGRRYTFPIFRSKNTRRPPGLPNIFSHFTLEPQETLVGISVLLSVFPFSVLFLEKYNTQA